MTILGLNTMLSSYHKPVRTLASTSHLYISQGVVVIMIHYHTNFNTHWARLKL